MGIIDTLAARATQDVEVLDGLHFRVTLLDPAGAQRIGVLVTLLAGLAGPPQKGKPPQEVSPKDAGPILQITAEIIAGCVTHASQDGEQWDPVQFVKHFKDQDPEQGKLWINVLPESAQGRLLAAIMTHWQEAREAIRPFRTGPESALDHGRDGEEIPPDAS